jgi:hypothetical protein
MDVLRRKPVGTEEFTVRVPRALNEPELADAAGAVSGRGRGDGKGGAECFSRKAR